MKRKIVTMKKITLAILALIIILCFGISFAEGDNALEQTTDASVQNDKAEKEEDILFRNIPWGSSVNETINALKDQFGSVQVAGRKLHPWFNIRPDNNKIHNTQVIICEVSIPELQVAGYGVYEFKTLDAQPNKFGNREWIPRKEGNNVILYFIPAINEDGKTISENEGYFVGAEYTGFYNEGIKPDDMIDEFADKLSDLYGSYKEDDRDEYGRINRNTHWKRWEQGNSLILMIKNVYEEENLLAGILDNEPEMIERPYTFSLRYINTSEELEALKEKAEEVYKAESEAEQQQKEDQKKKEQDQRGTDGL